MIQEYRMHVIQVFGSQYPESIDMVEARFFTETKTIMLKIEMILMNLVRR